jgi:fibro-slime domain-containing protein
MKRASLALVLSATLVACGGNIGGNTGSTSSSSAGSSTAHGGGGASSSSTGMGGDIGLTTSGTTTGTGGSGGGGSNCGSVLQATVRDFSPTTHPDFENALGDDPGIVQNDLGSDGKPVYAGNPTTPTTHGKMYFDEWYRDTSGINITIPITITLTPSGGSVYTYDNQAFFPIDDQGFGDEGNPHNYHFTLEAHTQFEYKGGEIFTFTGDDDLFTFINNKLAINLGGVHGAESATVDLDKEAATLGIQVGQVYALDLFFAERHTVDSHFRIDTTIGCFMPPPPPQ